MGDKKRVARVNRATRIGELRHGVDENGAAHEVVEDLVAQALDRRIALERVARTGRCARAAQLERKVVIADLGLPTFA